MNAFKAGTAYFAMVFAGGFVLGPIRVPFLVPLLGVRTAELLEMPIMFIVILLAARHGVRRFAVTPSAGPRLGVDAVALLFLLAAESTLVLGLQGVTLADYAASRDPVSGSVYLLMLDVFAAMPLLVGRK
jgi:hypothetical protein